MTAALDGLLEDAVVMAVAAGERTLEWFDHPELDVDVKADGSPVTLADHAAEEYLRGELGRRFPDDSIVGEEHADTHGTSGRTWVIDPVDGTKAFTRGVPLFATLLALIDSEGPAIGVAVMPALDDVVAAGRGVGCFRNGGRCRVNDQSSLADSYLHSSGYDYWPADQLEAVHASPIAMRTWGDAYGYVLVASGRAEAMVDHGLNLWDVAPMNVIIPEAGGRITDWHGNQQPLGGDVLATNGVIHDDVLALLHPT